MKLTTVLILVVFNTNILSHIHTHATLLSSKSFLHHDEMKIPTFVPCAPMICVYLNQEQTPPWQSQILYLVSFHFPSEEYASVCVSRGHAVASIYYIPQMMGYNSYRTVFRGAFLCIRFRVEVAAARLPGLCNLSGVRSMFIEGAAAGGSCECLRNWLCMA